MDAEKMYRRHVGLFASMDAHQAVGSFVTHGHIRTDKAWLLAL